MSLLLLAFILLGLSAFLTITAIAVTLYLVYQDAKALREAEQVARELNG